MGRKLQAILKIYQGDEREWGNLQGFDTWPGIFAIEAPPMIQNDSPTDSSF